MLPRLRIRITICTAILAVGLNQQPLTLGEELLGEELLGEELLGEELDDRSLVTESLT